MSEEQAGESKRLVRKTTIIEESWGPCVVGPQREEDVPGAVSAAPSGLDDATLRDLAEAVATPQAQPNCGCPTKRVVEQFDIDEE
jgi:hypothetical protein